MRIKIIPKASLSALKNTKVMFGTVSRCFTVCLMYIIDIIGLHNVFVIFFTEVLN